MTDQLSVVETGEQASRIMESDVFQLAVKKYKDYVINEWMNEDDPESREYRWHELNALDNLLVHLQSFIENGTYEKSRRKNFLK